MSSTNSTLGSITHSSAPCVSRIWLVVLRISPTKIEACCPISMHANAIPNTMAKYLPRLPVSILSAIQLIALVGFRGFHSCSWPLGSIARSCADCREAKIGNVLGQKRRIVSADFLFADEQPHDWVRDPMEEALADDAE